MKSGESSTIPGSERWKPETPEDRAKVQEQLERLLAHASFQNSKRYPRFLRHVVEQTLAGNEDRLKERLLGIDVFERAPDYDTNQDPVVRLSAGEVRKRLALYYQQPEHEAELVITLNAGSYVPQFLPVGATVTEMEAAEAAADEAIDGRRLHKALAWGTVGVAFALALFFCWEIVEDPARLFWEPVLHSSNRVTLCAGAPKSFMLAKQLTASLDLTEEQKRSLDALQEESGASIGLKMAHGGLMSMAHVEALIHVGALLEKHGKAFHVRLDSDADFPELREGPAVLIGAGDNTWTMRLTSQLRYGFECENSRQHCSIVDHRNLAQKNWTVALGQPYASLAHDYSMIARYHDKLLDQPVVIVAGLSSEGTAAASEFVAREASLRELNRSVGHRAGSANFQAILETQIVDGHAGPSRVVAIEVW